MLIGYLAIRIRSVLCSPPSEHATARFTVSFTMGDIPSLTTRVLDTSLGRPAAGMFLVVEHYNDSERDWQMIAEAKTDQHGRAEELLPPGDLQEGLYRITFDTDAYFGERGVETFYPSIAVNFQVSDPSRNHHVPLLVSPFGYSTFGIM